ncbi:phage tail protein [Magnetospirillum moscoviense]|uniref:phage tail protein n=1 Tax=Magnetospirillum moscoviense TaxID=1437059 RepID=UPI0009EE6B65|nr:tail fiber protein [Magnetospirillum moscoviense]
MTSSKALSFRVLAAAVAAGAFGAANPALACDAQPYMGTVCFVAEKFCPVGFLPADGRVVNVNDYQALFALYGNIYGGNGGTTFGLPNLLSRAPVGAGLVSPADPNVPSKVNLGQLRGVESLALTQAQMPAHTHAATFTGQVTPVTLQPKLQVVSNNTAAAAAVPSDAYPYLAGSPGGGPSARKTWTGTMTNPVNVGGISIALSGLPSTAGGPTVVNSIAGGYQNGAEFKNMVINMIPPELAMTACVAVTGIFPVNPN